jgi:poly-gamma-glutamate capsule biosynthesis protein CapA/YwtB (metallophosphatase superfamily)
MSSISICVSGQALLHGALDPVSPVAPGVGDVLRTSDASLANLEATVAALGAWPTKTKTLHLTDVLGIASLRALGFDVLTHANNHAFDLGPPGIAETREAVERAGMRLAGSGLDRAAAARAAQIETPRGRVAVLSADLGPQPEIVYASDDRGGINPLRIRRKAVVPPPAYALLRKLVEGLGDDRREAARAAVGYRSEPVFPAALEVFGTEVLKGTGFENRFEPDHGDFTRLRSALEKARAEADIVVVALHNHHWDPDWTHTPDWVTEVARSLIDAGADLIVGTGSPVLQGMSFYRKKPVLAGLGNFIFHTSRGETYDREGIDVWTGAICRCVFDRSSRTCRSVEVLPVAVGRPAAGPGLPAPSPAPLHGQDAQRAFDKLAAALPDEDRDRVTLLRPGCL